jgi:hypothetical protein
MNLPTLITNVIHRFGAHPPDNLAAPQQNAAWQQDIDSFLGVLVRRQRQMEGCRHDVPGDPIRRFDDDGLLHVIDETFGDLVQLRRDWIDARHEDVAPLVNAGLQKLCVRDREAAQAWFSKFGKDLRTYAAANVIVSEDATGTELKRAQDKADIGKALNLIRKELTETDTRTTMLAPIVFVPVRYREALKDFVQYGILSEHNNSDGDLRRRLEKLVALAPGDLSVRDDAADAAYHQTLRDCIATLTDAEIQALRAWFGAPERNADRLVDLLEKAAPVALRDLRNIQAYVNEMAAPEPVSAKVTQEFSARARTLSDLAGSLKPIAQCFHGEKSASVSKADMEKLVQACYAVERDQKDWAPLLSDANWNDGYHGSHATVLRGLVERLRSLAQHHQWVAGNLHHLTKLADELCFHLGCMLPEAEALWKDSRGRPDSDAAVLRLKPYLARMGQAVATGVASYRGQAHVHKERVESQINALRADLSKVRTADRAKVDRLVSELRLLSNEALISGTDPAEFAGLHAGLAHVLAATAHSLTKAQLTELAECEGLGLPVKRIACHGQGMRETLNVCVTVDKESDLVRSVIRFSNHAAHLHGALESLCPTADPLRLSQPDLAARGLEVATGRLGRSQRGILQRLLWGHSIQGAIGTLEELVKDGKVDLAAWNNAKVPESTIIQVEGNLANAISEWKHVLTILANLVGNPKGGRAGPGKQSIATDHAAIRDFVDANFGIKLRPKMDDAHTAAIDALTNVEFNLSVEDGMRRVIISSSRETHAQGSELLTNMMNTGSLADSTVWYVVRDEHGEEKKVQVNKQLMLDLDRLETSAGDVTLEPGAASKNPSRVDAFIRKMRSICEDQDKLLLFSGLLNQTSWGLLYQPPHKPKTRCEWMTYGSDKFENQGWPLGSRSGQDVGPDGPAVRNDNSKVREVNVEVRYDSSPQRFVSSLDRHPTEKGDLIVLKSELKTALSGVVPSHMADPDAGIDLDRKWSAWHLAIELKVPAGKKSEHGDHGESNPLRAELVVDKCVMVVEEPYRLLERSALPTFEIAQPKIGDSRSVQRDRRNAEFGPNLSEAHVG